MPSPQSNSELFLSLILLLIIASLTAYYADRKGRRSIIWFIIGLLLGVIAPIILFFLPSLKENGEVNQSTMSSPPVAPSLPVREEQKQLPSPIEDRLWYYLDQNHHQYGPVSIVALKDLWDRGQLDLNSYVWSEGMGNWQKMDDLSELKTALGKYQG
jgi:hypothetical protein